MNANDTTPAMILVARPGSERHALWARMTGLDWLPIVGERQLVDEETTGGPPMYGWHVLLSALPAEAFDRLVIHFARQEETSLEEMRAYLLKEGWVTPEGGGVVRCRSVEHGRAYFAARSAGERKELEG